MSYEYSLLQKQNLILYQIPPLASAKGHYLDTWKDMIWNGNIKVVSKNGNLIINFLNSDGTNFAVCPVPHKWEEAIQKCVDSSRGFAIRLQNPNGKFAWVGLAFRDRNDAFDFNVCFSDYEQKRELEINPNKFAKEFEGTPDFSIKEGQKIVLNFGEGKPENKNQGAKGKTNLSDFKFALPGQTGVGAKPEPTFQKPPPSINSGFGQDFNNFGGLSKKNDFGDFANFGFGQNAQPSNQFAGQPSAGNQNQIPSNFNFGGPSFPGNNQQQNKAPVKQSDNLLDL